MEEGQIFKSHDPVYDGREFSNSYFLSCVWKPDGKGKAVAGLTVMWNDKDNLVIKPKCKSRIEKVGLYPARFIVDYNIGWARSLNKLPSEYPIHSICCRLHGPGPYTR